MYAPPPAFLIRYKNYKKFRPGFEKLPSSQSFVPNSDDEVFSEPFMDDPNDESFQPSETMSESSTKTTEIETDSFSNSQVSF